MNDFIERYGGWALVAGAADGIGAAFSEALARKGVNLLMADKNAELLEEVSCRLESSYKIRTATLCVDLSSKDAWKNCMNAMGDFDCRLLVYVPAYSPVRPFLANDENDMDLFLDLNCRTPLQLCLAFGRRVKHERSSGILLLSSLAGLIAPVYSAAYAGTKAFNILLAESLNAEFREHSMDVTVCCAGITSTATFWSGNPEKKELKSGIMEPGEVARYALKSLGKKAICIPGWKNRLIYFFLTRVIPRKVAVRLVNRAMHKIYPDIRVHDGKKKASCE